MSKELFADIARLKRKLNEYHDMDRNFLPPALRELRNYIFQVHAAYEASMHQLLARVYLKESISLEHAESLMVNLTFFQKLKLTELAYPNFPKASAQSLNSMRNTFAHETGEELRQRYGTDVEIHRKLKSLSDYYDSLDVFWLEDGGLSREAAIQHVELNNKQRYA